jgi:4-hydroxy-3-polyprenylbenzoate decarboxylase
MIDLREFMEELDKHGELLSIDEEMDCNLEISAFSAMSNRTGAQAVHFKKLRGYSADYTVAANLFSGQGYTYLYDRTMWGRIAIGMEVDPKIDYETLIALIIDRYRNPIMPIKIETGACKEEIYLGKDVDLFKFPFPFLHREDGGLYGMGALISRDLDSDWQNMGFYRFMIVDHDKIVCDFLTDPNFSNDTKLIYNKYKNAGKRMPVAFALGGPPALALAAAMKVPPGESELSLAGGLNLDPINLVKAETSDLLVPADAEIVIEGEISPIEMVEEGPYGTIKGYSGQVQRPLIKVTALTHRKNPILPIIVDGTKTSDTQALISIAESARVTMLCQEEQLPVRWFQIPADWNLGFGIASIFNMVNGMVFRVARFILFSTNLFDKLIVVESDLNPLSIDNVINDLAHRCHPIRGEHVMHGFPPAVMPNYGAIDPINHTPRAYYDLCWPAYWKPEERPTPITVENCFPKELLEKVVKRWKEEFKIPLEPEILPELPIIGQQR